jgi:hypothetical protein
MPSVSAFRIVEEIDPRFNIIREVQNIHVVTQASVTGHGGFLETDIIYTDISLSSNDKEILIDRDAMSHTYKPFYLRSAVPGLEMFQPEIDASKCRLLGRRTVGIPGTNGQTSLSLQGVEPSNNRWIIPFSSNVLDRHRFYVIHRFLGSSDAKSAVQMFSMFALYPKANPGCLDIPPGNNHYSRLIANRNDSDSVPDDDVDTIVIDDSDETDDTDPSR